MLTTEVKMEENGKEESKMNEHVHDELAQKHVHRLGLATGPAWEHLEMGTMMQRKIQRSRGCWKSISIFHCGANF